ncbi:keratin, type I cytoskeletal 10-like [Euwallacea similis]|uniref:keratin, type I cytoskeletal 10-like n=1 Tax=Euwallacea similis TaxID=1736056 RepID=UPI003450260C
MMRSLVLVVVLCALSVLAQDSFESASVRFMLKIYDECANSEGFSPCLKKKAVTFLDRVARMEKLPLMEGVALIKSKDATIAEPHILENEIEQNLPRSVEGQEEALNNMLNERVNSLLGSRTIEISMPKISEMIEEGRGKGGGGGNLGGGGGGGGGKGGGKMKDMMGGMMMAIAAKMAALIPIAIAGLFLLAGKALITAKIALLISGIIAVKKLFAAKQQHGGGGGGGGHGGGWSSGGGGGWQSSGGGWDKRSLEDAQQLAYRSYEKP